MDPLTPGEREEHEDDLISFSDHELDLLGDVCNLNVLYAGGTSLLWLEGLSQRIGEGGNLTALDADGERVAAARDMLGEADLSAPVRLVAGDVFGPPFEPGAFDLVYSSGLFHELGVRKNKARDALSALVSVVRPGGRVATSDFVGTCPAAQLEDEEIQAEIAHETSGTRLFGIGPPERLVGLHEATLEDVRWRVLPPYRVRYLGKLFLAEGEPEELRSLPQKARRRLRGRHEKLRRRVEREGYTRPATLFVEGLVGTDQPLRVAT